jgi:thiol:disulfide interchange protein DsbC
MLKNIFSLIILTSLFFTGLLLAADPRTDSLHKLMPGVNIGTPTETPLKGIYQVKIGGRYAYVSADGNYALIGNLVDLKNGINLTEQAQAKENIPLLKSFPEKDMIIFQAKGDEKEVVTVFSDTSCPYCKKLHKEVPKLQQAGITVRYIPFPRGLKRGGGYREMKSVWCSDDRVRAMNIANRVIKGKLEKKDCAIDDVLKAGYELGNKVGVQGTPTIFLANGTKLGGYLPAEKIISMLSSSAK